jgi:hypothetical protein
VAGLVFIISCQPQKPAERLPIEGTWELIYGQYISDGTIIYDYPVNLTGTDMKMWSKEHFIFVGKLQLDTTVVNNYGGGTYTLAGNLYEENILYHAIESSVGQKVKMLLEISNDTLTQTWPVNADGQIDKNNFSIEKYIRLD